jgi:hypothetical protein
MRGRAAVVALCLVVASAGAGAAERVGWDGTWFGGWDKGNGVQLTFAGQTLISFYWRDDYKDTGDAVPTPDGGVNFTWEKGTASLSRTPDGGALLVVNETGRPAVSVPLKREGG